MKGDILSVPTCNWVLIQQDLYRMECESHFLCDMETH